MTKLLENYFFRRKLANFRSIYFIILRGHVFFKGRGHSVHCTKINWTTHDKFVGDLGRCHAKTDDVENNVILENVGRRLHPDGDSKTNEQTDGSKRGQDTCALLNRNSNTGVTLLSY